MLLPVLAQGAHRPPSLFMLVWGLGATAYGITFVFNIRGYARRVAESQGDRMGMNWNLFIRIHSAIFAILGTLFLTITLVKTAQWLGI
ncbi:MAG TPA: hypothetical protein VFV01_31645 [Spirillospora sp.]|nr:hypothetical protein [Spirillospora sp.]